MKTTLQQAEKAARQVSRKLGSFDWFLGVGIEARPRVGFGLSVRVGRGHGSEVRLPDRLGGVAVRVEEQAIPRAG